MAKQYPKTNVQKVGTKRKAPTRKCAGKKVVRRKTTNKKPKQPPLHRVVRAPATIIIEF